MGEILKILSGGYLSESELTIEENKSHKKSQQNTIHIQSDKFRIEMSEKDFFSVSFETLKAIKKMKDLKNFTE